MRKFAFIGLMLSSTLVSAAPYVFAPGSTLTTGPLSLPHSLQSVTHNPASGSIVIDKKESIRIGYFSSLGGGLEFGDVANFEKDLNDLIDTIDETTANFDNADDILDRFNEVLPTLGEEGYLKFEGRFTIPFFPMVAHAEFLKGDLSLNFALDQQVKGALLDAPLVFNDMEGTFDTNSAAYIKSASLTRFEIGYSRPVWMKDVGNWQGNLIAGVRTNVYNLKLSKQVIALNALDGEEISDVIQDEYKANQVSTTGVGIDLGLLWVAKKYLVGFTLTNINEPDFEYGTIGSGCEQMSSGASQNNCFIARQHIEALKNIKGAETHTMNALGTIDASYLIKDNWAISFAYELAEYNDLVGDENKWMTVSTSYYPKNLIAPAPRFGYRNNMAGSEISSVMLGATFFKIFNFDIEVALDNTTVDDSSSPRAFGLSFGFEEQF